MTAPLSSEANFEDLWSVKEATKFLGCKKTWLYLACERGEVPHVRLGAMIRFEPEVLRTWLKSKRVGPGAPAAAPVLSLGGRR